jgi:hypothetical protein
MLSIKQLILSAVAAIALVPPPAPAESGAAAARESAGTIAAFVQCRLFPRNLDATALDAYAGRSPAVEIRMDNTNDAPRNAEVTFNSKRHLPLDPYIPPYVAATATGLAFSIRCETPLPDMPMRWLVNIDATPPRATAHRIRPTELATGMWHRVMVPLDPPGTATNPLSQVLLGIQAPARTGFSLYLADVDLVYGDGRIYSMVSTNPPLFMTGYDPTRRPPTFPPLPERESLGLGLSHEEFIKEIVRAGELPMAVQDIRNRFPGIDFLFSALWCPRFTELADILPALPEGFFYQMQKARMNGAYMAALDAWARTADGTKIDVYGEANATFPSHPLARAAYKDEIDYAATLGVNNFVNPDYNWPWYRGIGYGKWTVQVFRENLAGEDEGLDLLPGPGGHPAELIHFHDYYEQNHGVRWSPADVGLSSWSEFMPVAAAKAADGTVQDRRNYSLATALAQYEWLRQAQRFGRWAKAHGGTHEVMPNPEDVGGGCDYVYYLRLADAGTLLIEYFGSPTVVRSAYLRIPMYQRAAQISGKELGTALELGAWGHYQPYWDPEVGYLVAYELGALGYKHYELDFMETGWAAWSDPTNAYDYDRYANAMSQGHGWWQARHEGAARSSARVFAVSLRSSVHYIQAGVWTLDVEDSFEDYLANAHVDVETIDTLGLPEVLPEADTLFYAPPVSRRLDAERVQRWLDEGGKTLITHSYIPLSLNRGAVELRPGVRSVRFRGEEFNYKDYMDRLQGIGEGFALHPAFAKLQRGAEDYWYLADPDQEPGPIAAGWQWVNIGTGLGRIHPLVSELPLANGSRIVYIHQRLEDFPPRTMEKLMATLIERYQLPVVARDDAATNRAITHTYRAGDSRVAVLWNERKLVELGWLPGYGAHLLVRRGPDQFDPDVRPYPIQTPDARCGAWVPVDQPGVSYRAYAFLANRETTMDATPDGWLRLQVPDQLAEQFYYAPDTPAFRARIETLKSRRREHLTPLWD